MHLGPLTSWTGELIPKRLKRGAGLTADLPAPFYRLITVSTRALIQMHVFPLICSHRLNPPLLIRIRVLQGGGTLFCSPRRPGISSRPEDRRKRSLSGFCPSGHPYPGCIYIRSWLSGTGTFLRALPFYSPYPLQVFPVRDFSCKYIQPSSLFFPFYSHTQRIFFHRFSFISVLL